MSPVGYKILSRSEWLTLERGGQFEGAAVDLADGYIHLSAPDQLAETAAKHFAGRGDLMLAEVDLERLGSALVWEPSRGGALFPHLYGVLTMTAVREARPFRVDDAGVMIFD